MTTIAYRDGVLASDSRMTVGGMVMSSTKKKVFRMKDGALFGFSGDQEDGERLKHAVKTGIAPPKLKNVSALLVLPDSGLLMLYEGAMWVELEPTYTALGTGAPYALTAMDCGLGAKDAVLMAMKRDALSGGKIHTVELKRE